MRSVSIVICILVRRDGVCGSGFVSGDGVGYLSGRFLGSAPSSVSVDPPGTLSSSGEGGATSPPSSLSSSLVVDQGRVVGESPKPGVPFVGKGVPNDEIEISPKFTLSSNSKPPSKFTVRSVGPGVFQKECSCCSSVGSGDAGSGGRKREEFGNGAFFAASAAFYIVDQTPLNEL